MASSVTVNSCATSPPVNVPDFVIADKIGSGGYADVYKAYRRSTGGKECVAVKAVLRSTLSPGAVDCLINEIKLLKKLDHEHIVKLRDFTCDSNYVYIIMEYCAGGDLSRFIKSRHRLPENAVQKFLQQLAAALKYMRDQNVSHFDLKPQNILLSSVTNPSIKIGDFGLAQLMHESEIASKVKGSPLYMAPEILIKKQYNPKVDLWSVGVILYECLFGRAPYLSPTIEELVQKIKSEKQIHIPSNSSISSDCRDLLMRCLQRDPETRIDFEDFFNHSFIDLKHIPCPENMEKARKLLTKAVELDEKQDFEGALSLYIKSLEYLVPQMHAEQDVQTKCAMKQYISQYLSRTEILKKSLQQQSLANSAATNVVNENVQTVANCEDSNFIAESYSGSLSSILSANHFREVDELLRLATTTPNMCDALDIGRLGELYDKEGSLATAIEKYELALGKLLSLLSMEPAGRRRELLVSVVKCWISRAENVKEILQQQKMSIDDSLAHSIPTEKSNTSKNEGKVVLHKNLLLNGLNEKYKTLLSLGKKSASSEETSDAENIRKGNADMTKGTLIRKESKDNVSSYEMPVTTLSAIAASYTSSSKLLTEADYETHCCIQ